MDTTNQIEKQLENRAVKELAELIDTFITQLDELDNKYHINTVYYNLVDREYSGGTMCLNKYDVRHHLLYMLKDAYLNGMVRHKSKELLAKLDLLS
jgi:hypothetical protein